MAIEGKKKYQVYLDETEVEIIKEYLDTRPGQGGFSELIQRHVTRCANIIKKNPKALEDIEPGRLTVKKFWKLLKLDL